MASPVIVTNELNPSTIPTNGSTTWRTVAQDPDARTATLSRPVTDTQGNTILVEATMILQDPLTYGPPTCDDPGVSLVVDSSDPTIVHVTASPLA